MFNSPAAPLIGSFPFLVDIANSIAFDPTLNRMAIAQAQTVIVSIGLMCSAYFTYLHSDKGDWANVSMISFVTAGAALISARIVNTVVKLAAGDCAWDGTFMLMDDSCDITGEPLKA